MKKRTVHRRVPARERGLFWHVHHEELVEYSGDIKERRRFVRGNKPSHEVPTRLKWMQKVESPLPKDLRAAIQALTEADRLLKHTADLKGLHSASDKIYQRAWNRRRAANALFNKRGTALANLLRKYCRKLEELHKQEHPDCPWDGYSIFPDKMRMRY